MLCYELLCYELVCYCNASKFKYRFDDVAKKFFKKKSEILEILTSEIPAGGDSNL